MLRKRKQKMDNSGNTFIFMLVTIACMGILVAVILASVGYYYRECRTNLDNKNNFYELEKALDDIYTGIGNDSITHLMTAYSDTVEVMVQYEVKPDGTVVGWTVPTTQADTDKMNALLKQKFMDEIANDDRYRSQQQLYTHLSSFIADTTDAVLVDNTAYLNRPALYTEFVTTTDADGNTIYDKVVIHNIMVSRTTSDGYQQTITTDLEITEPGFGVAFSSADRLDSALYDFAMIADRGAEFELDANVADTTANSVMITGDIYAASDFYNKDYPVAVSNYSAVELGALDGVADRSRYSGLYADGTNLSISADKVIVPGSISVINDGSISIYGITSSNLTVGSQTIRTRLANVWADNIVVAPSSTRTVGLHTDEGSLTMYANAYIADDLQVDGDKADVTLVGRYYGYNYSQDTSDQNLSDYALQGKDHFNSSAIVVNGNAANLDFSMLNTLHVAGRAYIETSREKNVSLDFENNSATTTYTNTAFTDVQTGESISVKSNQLAYMPLATRETNGVVEPVFTEYSAFNSVIVDEIQDRGWVDPNDMVVTCQLSGNTFYFLKLKNATASAEFFNWYANTLPTLPGYEQATDLANVTSFADFQLTQLNISDATSVATSGAYTTKGALNLGTNASMTIKGESRLMGSNGTPLPTLNQVASDYNSDYKEMKYELQAFHSEDYATDSTVFAEKQAAEATVAAMDSGTITPINRFLDLSKIERNIRGETIGTYHIWIVEDGDVTVDASAADANGKVQGLIVTKGDVHFADDVQSFEGLIITGSKIFVDHKMTFTANAEIIKTILRTAESSDEYSFICDIFKDFTAADADNSSEGVPVGQIEVGDVLQYTNWKKNAE